MLLLTLACDYKEDEAVWLFDMTADKVLDIFDISIICISAPRNNNT